MLALSYVATLPLTLLTVAVPSLEPSEGPRFTPSLGIVGKLVVVAIIAPLIETAVIQWLPIRILRGRFQLPWAWTIIMSASLFAAVHTYDIIYIAFAFLMGLVLAYCFALKSIGDQKPVLITALVHSLRNVIATFA
jgi:uncharacterized protein